MSDHIRWMLRRDLDGDVMDIERRTRETWIVVETIAEINAKIAAIDRICG